MRKGEFEAIVLVTMFALATAFIIILAIAEVLDSEPMIDIVSPRPPLQADAQAVEAMRGARQFGEERCFTVQDINLRGRYCVSYRPE